MYNAQMKALREIVGMSERELALELGLDTTEIVALETGNADVPREVLSVLEQARKEQNHIVLYAIEVAKSLGSNDVTLPYWVSEQDYLEHSNDAREGVAGSWRMANVNLRAAALILEDHGFTITWVNGSENVATTR